MSSAVRLLLAITLTSIALAVPAAHITDKLLAGFYDQPTTQGQPQRVLPSGTPVEILERKGEFSRVRLTDNTEGWVQSEYLTEQKPAQVMLLEAQARAGALEQELARAKGQLADARDATAAAAPAPPLQGQDQTRQGAPAGLTPAASRRTLPWVLGLAALAFAGGFVCGVVLFQYRFRKRFGGLRL